MSCLCILEINPLSVASFANIFSHSEGCLLVLFMVSFAVQKLLSFFVFVFVLGFDFLSFFFLNKFIYLFLAALGLRCCAQVFSSCERGLLFLVVRRLLVAEHGL